MAIEKYLDNITSQHRDKPKFISWLSKSLTILDHAYNATKSLDINFDIDNAIGKQLDSLGVIIGRGRVLDFQPLNGHSPVLDDDTYRLVLKTKVAINMWDGTIPHIYDIWSIIFKDIGLQIKDNQDMSFDAYITGYVNQIRQDLIQHGYIVPKPEGVRVNYIGKSLVDFGIYSGMLVCTSHTQTIEMDYDPKERVSSEQYPYMIVQGLNVTTLNLKGVDDNGIV